MGNNYDDGMDLYVVRRFTKIDSVWRFESDAKHRASHLNNPPDAHSNLWGVDAVPLNPGNEEECVDEQLPANP